MFPPTDISDWGARGTQGGPWASFFQRYGAPLQQYACRRLGVDAELGEELAARFLAREMSREQGGESPIFRLYDPGRGRFRSLLATSFFRFARDELKKESKRRGSAVELEQLPEEAADEEFSRLVAREFFEVVRERIRADCDEQARAVLDLKWPTDPFTDPLRNADVERQLGLSRSKVRTTTRHIGDRFVHHLRELATQAGLTPAEICPFLGDVCHALDRGEH